MGGPILLVLALVHHAAFAQRSATAALLGLVSLAAFVLAYAATARHGWSLALLAAWSAFALATLAFALLTKVVHIPPALGLLAACASFVLAARLMPTTTTRAPAPAASSAAAPPPAWDLPVRAACAAAMVLAVTGLSSAVGSRVSGLLAPAPIITSILAAFTQAQRGIPDTLRLLRGMLTGFFAFAAFCFTAAALLGHTSLGVAFAVAAVVSVLTSAVVARGESIGPRPYSR